MYHHLLWDSRLGLNFFQKILLETFAKTSGKFFKMAGNLRIFQGTVIFQEFCGNLRGRLRLSVKHTSRVIDAKYVIKPVVYGDFWRLFAERLQKVFKTITFIYTTQRQIPMSKKAYKANRKWSFLRGVGMQKAPFWV